MSARWLASWLAAASLVSVPVLADDAAAPHPIVFVAPASAELEAALLDALSAQLSGTAATAVFERFPFEAGTLRRQVDEARTLAAAHSAVGVFWLDHQSETEWLLYLTEPGGERVLVRRIPRDPASPAAAIEAVSVITRESSVALLAGQTIGMQPVAIPEPDGRKPPLVEPPPRRVPLPAPPPPPHHPLSLAVGYSGDSPSEQVAWQSGVHLSAEYRFRVGVYMGAGYVFHQDTTVRAPNVAFRVSRSPFDARLGMQLTSTRLVPIVELRGLVELQSRQDLSVTPPLEPTENETRAAAFVSGRAGMRYEITSQFYPYLAAGVDLALNRFSYVSRAVTGDEVLLSPHRLRPALEVGVAFRP